MFLNLWISGPSVCHPVAVGVMLLVGVNMTFIGYKRKKNHSSQFHLFAVKLKERIYVCVAL